MTKRIIAAGIAALVAGALAACSGPAAATIVPQSTQATSASVDASTAATASSAAPSPSVTASPSARAATQPKAAAVESPFERSRKVVASLVKGDQEGAAKNMTARAGDVMLGSDMKDYLFGGRLVGGCHVSDHELTLLNPKPNNYNAFAPDHTSMRAGDQVSAVRVDCMEASFGIVVGTSGPRHDVEGVESHPFPHEGYFAGS
ncbi:hypothetical protein [Arthrobacter sp. ES1]|uniref:hypothetical protein n=1 Tax=Arthrobacter sp. ES1 TaxID=1897056 RepID=UPI001D0010B2|nr:hypothetical protein [Arthrobacter sp. ES1]MCB5280481.1 hypothetical protein [Arthrobacter sp. ES1]